MFYRFLCSSISGAVLSNYRNSATTIGCKHLKTTNKKFKNQDKSKDHIEISAFNYCSHLFQILLVLLIIFHLRMGGRSKVWKYFNKIPNAAICKLEKKDNGSSCEDQIPRIGGNTQSMWSHLQCHHKLEYSDAKESKSGSPGPSQGSKEEKAKPRKRRESIRQSEDVFEGSRVKEELDESDGAVNEIWLDSNQHNEYDSESSSASEPSVKRQRQSKSNRSNSSKRIDFALSKVLIASNIPFEMIDSKNFIEFVQELKQNPYYKLPRSHDLRDKVFSGLSKEMLK